VNCQKAANYRQAVDSILRRSATRAAPRYGASHHASLLDTEAGRLDISLDFSGGAKRQSAPGQEVSLDGACDHELSGMDFSLHLATLVNGEAILEGDSPLELPADAEGTPSAHVPPEPSVLPDDAGRR